MPVITESPSSLFVLSALQLSGVGPAKVRTWIKSLKRTAYIAYDDLHAGFQTQPAEEVKAAVHKAQAILEECERLGIQVFCLHDAGYPKLLAQISDPPPVLFVRGQASILHMKCFAVVGTRNASARGLAAAGSLGESLALNGVCVVSGLALGIDAAGHRGALRRDGKTIAILAHGLHTIQPSSNRKLGLEILDRGGTLVSEHPPGVPPRPGEFVRRNRIQSGISVGSIIVESGEEGGAMHQARFTKDQKRILTVAMPVPKPTGDDFNYDGGRFLIRTLNAKPIAKPKDLIEFLDSPLHNEQASERTAQGQGQLGLS